MDVYLFFVALYYPIELKIRHHLKIIKRYYNEKKKKVFLKPHVK